MSLLLVAKPGNEHLAQPLAQAVEDRIVKAPIVPDGDVAGADTDFGINLDISLDPNVAGRTLLAEKSIKIVILVDQARDCCHRITVLLFWETEQLEQGLGKP